MPTPPSRPIPPRAQPPKRRWESTTPKPATPPTATATVVEVEKNPLREEMEKLREQLKEVEELREQVKELRSLLAASTAAPPSGSNNEDGL